MCHVLLSTLNTNGSFTLREMDLGMDSDSCTWQLELESESDSVKCENFYIVPCSYWVWNLNLAV